MKCIEPLVSFRWRSECPRLQASLEMHSDSILHSVVSIHQQSSHVLPLLVRQECIKSGAFLSKD